MRSIVRTTRARIIRLKNDYKELMVRIEKGLHEHHARLQEQARNNTTANSGALGAGSAAPAALEAPFANVNSVVAGSPAETAGLQVGDNITKFGWVDWTNHDKLARLPQVVSQNEGVSNVGILDAHAQASPSFEAYSKSCICTMLTEHSFPLPSRYCGRGLLVRQSR